MKAILPITYTLFDCMLCFGKVVYLIYLFFLLAILYKSSF